MTVCWGHNLHTPEPHIKTHELKNLTKVLCWLFCKLVLMQLFKRFFTELIFKHFSNSILLHLKTTNLNVMSDYVTCQKTKTKLEASKIFN